MFGRQYVRRKNVFLSYQFRQHLCGPAAVEKRQSISRGQWGMVTLMYNKDATRSKDATRGSWPYY